jgi:hypothetical protein
MTTITAKIQILPTQSDVQAMLDTFAVAGGFIADNSIAPVYFCKLQNKFRD